MLINCLLISFLIYAGGNGNATGAETATIQTHPFSVQDMLAMDRISEPKVSPDGKFIVFTLRKTDLEADRGRGDLWLVGVDGKGLKQLTTDPEGDSNPCWSPDSKTIYFISSRSGTSQVWKIAIDGGEAQKVTALAGETSNLIISGDGSHIAFTVEVFPNFSIEQTKKKLEELKNKKSSGRIYDKLFIRHWDNWSDGRRSHLFVMAVDGNTPVDVMKEMDADTPSKPFGGPEELTFTPDRKAVIFSAKKGSSEDAWSTNFDLYLAPIDGSEKPKNLTEKNKATDTQPIFSPDGLTLAYLAMSRPGYESDQFKIILRNWQDGSEKVLTEKWDRSPSEICFSKDGEKIYATAENTGQKSLFEIDTESGKVKTIVEKGTVSSPGTAEDKIIFTLNNLKLPAEIFSVNSDGSGIEQITKINTERTLAARMGDYEQFTFKGWNEENVYCYVVKPADFNSEKKCPVAFLIHGGPQGSFSNNFHYRWNPQAFTGAGYAVIMVDFHGSTGYGQAFCDSIRGDWGGKPLEDLQKGLAAALKRYPWMDGNRVGALGASFGGYMINWIEGNWPERFKCLVNHDGDFDERMAYFDTEELWFPEWDLFGTPWGNPQSYEKQNPVNLVRNWKTPMLVIHGGRDYRVTDSQGIGTFTALQRLGVESKLLYFPDESHWVLKPSNSILWHKTIIEWLDKWLK
jgi:dipeptidyl aminopeptidase/acylaminoacyl peptidase